MTKKVKKLNKTKSSEVPKRKSIILSGSTIISSSSSTSLTSFIQSSGHLKQKRCQISKKQPIASVKYRNDENFSNSHKTQKSHINDALKSSLGLDERGLMRMDLHEWASWRTRANENLIKSSALDSSPIRISSDKINSQSNISVYFLLTFCQNYYNIRLKCI